MMTEKEKYTAYDFDNFTPGCNLKIEHTVYYKDDTDLSDLLSMPVDKVQAMRDKSVAREEAAYEKVRSAARNWEKSAAVTRRLDRAIEYLKTPETQHTSNEWIKGKSELDYNTVSNKVYSMSYRIYEYSSWRTDTKKYEVNWFLYANSPRNNYNKKITGQDRVFATKEEAQKYIQGRIKAYEHLFNEISPPIPNDLVNCFSVYGNLLPGYTTEEMQKQKSEKKPSIKKQLNELKSKSKEKSQPEPVKKKTEPEL